LEIRDLSRPGLSLPAFDLDGGEAVAVVGPSGSGKSLLLRAIADLDPNQAEIRLDGVARAGLPAPDWRRRVTYVGPVAAWWRARVGEHFHAADQAALPDWLRRLGLPSEALDWPVERLSTGEGQRLSLIRALVQAPQVLLLDEPTAALDAEAAASVEALILASLSEGTAILFVTHNLEQAGRLARRCLRLEPDGVAREERL
jgi:ABC-type iron transport system FetAB ATPase subunit